MTRNDAMGYTRIGGQTTGFHIFDIDKIIEHIYDDFERQTCVNCAFYSVEYTGVKTTANTIEEVQSRICQLNCASNYTTGEVDPEFGCNRFTPCK